MCHSKQRCETKSTSMRIIFAPAVTCLLLTPCGELQSDKNSNHSFCCTFSTGKTTAGHSHYLSLRNAIMQPSQHFATDCIFPALPLVHWVRVAVKQFSGLSNGCGLAPKCSLKDFIVMITEVCGAEHCGSAAVLSFPGENGTGQCGAAKVRRSTTWKITFQLSMMWHLQHSTGDHSAVKHSEA